MQRRGLQVRLQRRHERRRERYWRGLIHGVLDAKSFEQAEMALAEVASHPLGMGLGHRSQVKDLYNLSNLKGW